MSAINKKAIDLNTSKTRILYEPIKERIDRTAQSQVIFDEFIYDAKQLDTVILLLNSNEDHIILNALHHLDKFAMKFIGNYTLLYDRNIIPSVLRHIESNHRFIRRFAMKILSQLFVVPEAKQELIQNLDLFTISSNTFMQLDDNFLMEYSLIILNELYENPVFQQNITNSELVKVLFDRIVKTNDPDVLHQSLKLINNITSNLAGLEEICGKIDIPFAFLLATTKNEYTRIQMCTLNVLANIGDCNNPIVSARYNDPLFMEEIFSILEVRDYLE